MRSSSAFLARFTTRPKIALWLGAAGLLLLTAACYLPVLENDFVNFDDERFLYGNELIRGLDAEHLGLIFERQLFTRDYKPLVYLSWAIEYRLFGMDPRVFHVDNLLLHLANTLLALMLLGRLAPGTALRADRESVATRRLLAVFFAVAFFALHPLKVESVAWATERKDVLFAFFYLCALLAYVSFCRGSRRSLWASSGLFSLALLSKGMSVTLPAALFVIDLTLGRPMERRRVREKWPFAPPLVLALWLYGFLGPRAVAVADAHAGAGEPLRDAAVAGYRFLIFLRRLLAPEELAPYYRPPTFLRDPTLGQALALAGAAAVVIGLAILLRRRALPAAAGLLFFAVSVSPALLLPANATNLMPDRYTYLPSLGLAGTLAAALYSATGNGRRRRWAVALLALGALGWLSIRTHAQVAIWRDSETLWSHVLATQGPLAVPFNNRAVARRARGELDRALADLDRAIELDPRYPEAYNNRGNARRAKGDLAGALADLDRSAELEPRYPQVWLNRGRALRDAGRRRAAIASFDRAIGLDPDAAVGYLLRGSTHSADGRWEEAAADLDRALALGGVRLAALRERAALRMHTADFPGAEADYSEILELVPDSAPAHNNRGRARLSRRDLAGAVADFDRALELAPGYALAHRNRGDVEVLAGRVDEACSDWRRARELDPDDRQPIEERLERFCPAVAPSPD